MRTLRLLMRANLSSFACALLVLASLLSVGTASAASAVGTALETHS